MQSRAWPSVGAVRRALWLTAGALVTALAVREWYLMGIIWVGCLAFVLPMGMLFDTAPTGRRMAIAHIRGTWRPGRARRLVPIVQLPWLAATLWKVRQPTRHLGMTFELLLSVLDVAVVVTCVMAYLEMRKQQREFGSEPEL